ncbi:MAG: hypothetical protein OEV06_05300 [Anaerolineae bacterium]|nr:hypothetical protein [Anaerolineae bacterium]
MTLPSVGLGIILALLYGSLFHVWRGGGPGKLILYLIFSLIGFWGGHILANMLSIELGSYGPLHLGPATITAFAALFIGNWLGAVESVQR